MVRRWLVDKREAAAADWLRLRRGGWLVGPEHAARRRLRRWDVLLDLWTLRGLL